MRVGPARGDDREKNAYVGSEMAESELSQSSIRDKSASLTLWQRLRRAAIGLVETILFEPQSSTQREQLARKILDYSHMNRRGSEPSLIHVPAMANRFHEPRRNVRRSLELLEENGAVERTQSKDHWKLTIRVNTPNRATYNPPQVSSPFPKMPLNPPPGWIELQNRAHKAKDVQEFNQIIDEMNQLLSAHEKAAAGERDPDKSPPPKTDQKQASSGGQK
jgi:hypothetical protein